jgi:hypothetical protein
MTYELKKINLFSAIKMSLLIHVVLGLVLGLFVGFMILLIGGLANMIPSGTNYDGAQTLPFAAGIFGGFAIMLVYVIFIPVMGVIGTAIVVSLYNLFARLWGGMKLELDNIVVITSAAVSPSTPEIFLDKPGSTSPGGESNV